MKKLCLHILLFFGLQAAGQVCSVTGYIVDSSTGELLAGAAVSDSASSSGSVANSFGYFSLRIRPGRAVIRTGFLGYKTSVLDLVLTGDTILKIRLDPYTYNLNEVVIEGGNQRSRNLETSFSIPAGDIRKIPQMMSEPDLLKTLHLMPGIQSGTEGTSGILVRGGGPDQNLILLDGATVYNPDHLFGFMSVFNTDAIRNVTLITGGFPARYGGRLSSVVDIRMKEGNSNAFHFATETGLLSSKIILEGPVKNDRTSYLVSARRSWLDLLTKKTLSNEGWPLYFFHDLTAKINHVISDRSRIFLSLYTGKDHITGISTESSYVTDGVKYFTTQDQVFGWGNLSAVLRLNHIFNKRLFSNSVLVFSDYGYFDVKKIGSTSTIQSSGISRTDNYNSDFHSGIRDIAVKNDFDYRISDKHHLESGIAVVWHEFTPRAQVSVINDSPDSTFRGIEKIRMPALESSLYLEDEIQLKRLSVRAGARLTACSVKDKIYCSVEPRLSAGYMFNDLVSLKLSWSEMNQYIHLLTSSRITFPTDLWVPVTDKVKPQVADQVTIGSVLSLRKNTELSVEAYYKTMKGLIEYSEGNSWLDAGTWEDRIEMGGIGRAYGLELMLKKNSGKATGWISYSIAKTERQFENINSGNWFPYKYDRRHDVNIVLTYRHNDRIDAGLTWEYSSGNLFTVITDAYGSFLERGSNNYATYFESRNNYRLPAFHHLDLGINFHKQKKRYNRTWSFSVYNVYNRKNVFFVYSGNDDIHGRKDLIKYKRYTLFPVLPSLSYSLKF